MKKLLAASATIALIAAASQAEAAGTMPWPNWYLGLSGGVAFLSSTDISGAKTGNIDYSTGEIGTVSLGYRPQTAMFPFNNMRLEAELGYHYNSLSSLGLGAGPSNPAPGAMQTVSYLGNLYYDFHNPSQWTPYLGAGAGGARVMLNKSSGLGNTGDNSNSFAYQFMGGISYAPSTLPMTEWSLGYRYFTVQNPEFTSATGKIKLDALNSSNIELGARFRF